MKSIEKLLSLANSVLSSSICVDTATKKQTKGVYDGYLAGFGPSVITSGLVQTLATYEADTNRKEVLDLIAKVAMIPNASTSSLLLTECLKPANATNSKLWRTKIIDASIALKMMIRTYGQPLNQE